ncbi:MAG: hypothetical protein HYV16_14185 [Gammaproteobacteria bacterium]|nr:hypothetical protein [Gammaproteobacteria bacterium]
MGKQERAVRLALVALLINLGYYLWVLYLHGSWDPAVLGARAFGKLLLTSLAIGITFEALIGHVLRRSRPGEVLEDERDRAIRAAGTDLAFKLCVAGLFVLAWQIYVQQKLPELVRHELPPEAMLDPALLAHLPLAILAVALAAKYGLQIWLYRRDRLEAAEDMSVAERPSSDPLPNAGEGGAERRERGE